MTFAHPKFRVPLEVNDWKQDRRNILKAITDYLQSLESPDALVPHVQGTWDPLITFSTPGDLVVGYSAAAGYYTKIGHWVSAEFIITTNTFTHTTAASLLLITGLPFVVKDDGAGAQAFFGPLNWQGITNAALTNMVCAATAGNNYLTVVGSGSGAATANITAADMPTGGNVILRGTITYRI